MNKHKNMSFVFFGTSDFATAVLDGLQEGGYIPQLVVTRPDRPAGRGMQMTPPAAKMWAEKNDIPALQPKKLDKDFIYNLQPTTYNLFIIAAYGALLPKEVIDAPEHGTLNVHPSLLPHHRGPSPIEAQILADNPDDVGVSIMLLDEEMDHGPLLAQTQVQPEEWPPKARELETMLAHEGSVLLTHVLPKWIHGDVEALPQEHDEATYTDLVTKEDAELETEGCVPKNTRENFLKIRAYDENPRAYFFTQDGTRVIATDADWESKTLIINKVVPEGKKEMSYESFLQAIRTR